MFKTRREYFYIYTGNNKNTVCKGQTPVAPPKRIPIGIDDACKLIGKAKPTVYTLVRKRLLPCYKNGKHLYFFEDELLA